jgi:hypothetical protein
MPVTSPPRPETELLLLLMHDARAISAVTAKTIRIFFLFIYINILIIIAKSTLSHPPAPKGHLQSEAK